MNGTWPTFLNQVVFVLLLMTFLLTGCAGHGQIVSDRLSKDAEVFVGKTTDDLLKAKGPPDASYQLKSGEQLWTYRSIKAGQRKGTTISVGGGRNRSSEPEYISWRETTNFIIGQDDFVLSYTVAVE
jgi:hypothetical protein